jgi:hypothetical protein
LGVERGRCVIGFNSWWLKGNKGRQTIGKIEPQEYYNRIVWSMT